MKVIIKSIQLTFQILVLSFACGHSVYAQVDSMVLDSTVMMHDTFIYEPLPESYLVRDFDVNQLRKYKENPDFLYEEAEYEEGALSHYWKRLKRWLAQQISHGTSSKTFQYVLILVALVFFVYALRKTHVEQIINSKQSKQAVVKELDIRTDEDILLERLAEAEKNNNLKEAVRLQYLIILKALDTKNLIKWTPYKLSEQYKSELSQAELVDPFNQLTYFFNYVWYGERTIDASKYQELKTTFSNTLNAITDV